MVPPLTPGPSRLRLLAAALPLLAGGCSDYPPGTFDPVSMLCPGEYDPVRAECTVETDIVGSPGE